MKQTKNALISVYDKDGIADFARELSTLGWNIFASGGTAKHLAEAGIAVTDVATIVGEAILNHKVVTLSREIHAGLLALGDAELAELETLGIPKFDMVCGDLYPLEETIRSGGSLDDVRKQTDIGGPTMLSSGAKGRRIVISEKKQRQEVIDWLKAGMPDEDAFLTKLEAHAQYVVSRYRSISATHLGGTNYFALSGEKIGECKYGENAWQTPALLYKNTLIESDPLSLEHFTVIQGTPLSYNNMCDIDRELQTITHIAGGFDENFSYVPHIAIGVKHGNACGVAYDKADPMTALRKMLEGDVRAIFGGIVMLNFPLTEEVAEALLTHAMNGGKRLLDGIIAPSADESVLAMLQRKGDKCRIVINPALANLSKESLEKGTRTRHVRGGSLTQPNYTFVPNMKSASIEGEVSDAMLSDLVLAWAVGSTSNSNTITITKGGALVGNGVGQQDRVGACELAMKRADDSARSLGKTDPADLTGACAYSDSFFPFPDGPQALIDRGIKAIFATTGSVKDPEVIALCRENGVTFVSLPDAEARGFYMH